MLTSEVTTPDNDYPLPTGEQAQSIVFE